MNAGSLGGGRYLSLVLSGLVELPGLYVSYYLLNRYIYIHCRSSAGLEICIDLSHMQDRSEVESWRDVNAWWCLLCVVGSRALG